jgi:quinone-modifying oxidoreductase subunit QmoC
VLLSIALFVKDPIESALGISQYTSGRIVYSYSGVFPHWILNAFFLLISAFVIFVIITGVVRFWRVMKASNALDDKAKPVKGLISSSVSVFKNIITHNDFASCTSTRSRYLSHLSVFFGFSALFLVSIWVITASYNPLIRSEFIYPFGFWNPWKILANLGGVALVGGCLLMIWDRLRNNERVSSGAYFDWIFISMLLVAAITGFITEILHYLRLEPHRHIIYFIHLVFASALLMYLPNSKFAHMIYRTIALIYAEYIGRKREASVTVTGERL